MRFDLGHLPRDPILLQRMVRDAVETIDRTTADLTASAALAKLQTLRIAKLEHEVARLRRSQFGRSSEQHAADQLRLLFDEAMTSDAVTGAPIVSH